MNTIRYIFTTIIFPLILSFPAMAQDEESTDKTDDSKDKAKTKGYASIITSKATSSPGLFTVHQVGDKYYFEIPKALLEREILVVSRISGHVKGLNFGGAGMKSRPQQVVRWQRHNDHMVLRSVSYNSVASFEDPIYESVRNNNFEPVIERFKIQAENPDSTGLLIDVTSFFASDVAMLGPLSEEQRKEFEIKGFEKNRSFIQHVRSFPENLEVRHVLTYKGTKLPANPLTQTLSIEMNQSFIALPEDLWQPRTYDDRLGYFSIRQIDYSADDHKATSKRYITRWRLDPVDREAYDRGELVEPKKQIVYYIDPATPEKWRPYLKQGVDDWQVAFEAAGFKNAITAKDPPSKEEDPNWSPEDVRYSVIRYVATDIQNAQGPHVHDPRTGEIIESDIIWYHNVMNLLRNWHLIQTAAVNPAARAVRFDDALMGELIRFVAAHEVGHTLGLPHNMGASPAYPVDSLRKAGFVQRMGVSPSIMDYARFNYVAQPEDDGAGLMPRIGPYDLWSIEYGYRLIPNVTKAEDERPVLNGWIKERADDPLYRYGKQQGRVVDPSAQTEDLGHDAVSASMLGIKNLQRIVPELIGWTERDGENYEELKEIHQQMAGQYRRYIGHVVNNIGGIYDHAKTTEQEGAVHQHVPKPTQEGAMLFLQRYAYAIPNWLLNREILERIGPATAVEMVEGIHRYALSQAFDPHRLKRMMENEAINVDQAFTMQALFRMSQESIFTNFYGDKNKKNQPIDVYSRNLQRAYVERMGYLIHGKNSELNYSDARALARASLKSLEDPLRKGGAKADDPITRAHYADLRARAIQLLVNEEVTMPSDAFGIENALEFDGAHGHECWH